MSTIRLKKVRNLLVNWFQSHDLVNSAKFGDFVQMYMSEQIEHSCVVIDLIRVPELTRSKIGYQFVFTYADRMFADRRNETDIKNDCVRVFHDFVIAASNDIELRKYITGLTTGNIEIFSQRSGDLVAGGVMTVSINIISDQDKCAIPITPIPTPPPPTCADVIIQLNEVTTFTLPSGATQNINLLDENEQPLEVIDVDGDDVKLNTWWKRNPLWLFLPEINVGDNRFVGLYAVFEDDADGNTITINIGAGNQINYGDGTIITSIAGANTHQYDYATIVSPILQMEDGTNYKMVVVDCDITGTLNILLNQTITGRSQRVTGWLDIVAAGSSLVGVRVSDSTAGSAGFAMFLERLLIIEMNTSGTPLAVELLNSLPRIKVLQYPMLDVLTNLIRLFNRSGDFRDSQGQPISINNTAFTGNFNVTFFESAITKLGDLILPNATAINQPFNRSKLQEIGNINLSSVNSLSVFANDNYNLQKVGTITVGTNLTTINALFVRAYNLRRIIFAGDMSSVTNTTAAFFEVFGLQELILPNITVGFDIRWSAVSGQALQDLGASIGTANGSQTITLPSFTIGEPTTVFTSKGYTIAYA